MNIYLDTNLWNHLIKQSTEVEDLLSALDSRAASLVLGDENLYELLKTFPRDEQRSRQPAIKLFLRLRQFTSRPIPIVRTNMELLAAEMWALKLGQETINPFIKHDDRELIHAVIEGASTGNLADRERNHIASRARQAEANRVGQVEHMKNEHRTKSYLKTVSPEHMPKWLDQETSGQVAREHLAWEIMQYFPEATKEEADEYAVALQRSASCRMARGLIRRTLYYNWRCAHRGSVPPDLYFDSNHVINSTYCEVYATEEAGQLDYAKYLLTTATAVAIYNRSEFPSISDWLLSLAG